MDDTLDVLQVPREGEISVQKRVRRKPKRPEGLSREAYSLLGDGNYSISPTPLYRKRRVGNQNSKRRLNATVCTVSYKRKEFENKARSDGLKLKRWVKCYTDKQGNFREANSIEYPFTRLDIPPDVVSYSQSEWDRYIAPLSIYWSKEETDYLLELCRQFSLRFVVIHDRYSWRNGERSVEDLKERYYAIAHCLAVVRSGDEPSSRYLQRNPYDAIYERKRRDACRTIFEMTVEEELRDNAILEEAEKIEAKRLENAQISGSLSSQDTSTGSFSQLLIGRQEKLDQAPLHDAQGNPWRPPSGVYVRGVHTKKLFSHGKGSTGETGSDQKLMREFNVENCFPTVCNKKLMKAWIDLRNDVGTLARLRDVLSDGNEDTTNLHSITP
eukprot:g329.t1